MDPIWLWVVAAVVCGIIEVLSVSFVFLMLGVGALAGAVVAGAGGGAYLQISVFAAVSVVLLLAVRPFLKGRLYQSSPDVRTNTDALIGAGGYALSTITVRDGRARLRGAEWSARTQAGTIEEGARVVIIGIAGATAFVAPSTEPQ